jgi:predicted glycosyltransferase
MKLLLVVTHLLGSGHLSRALTLGRAFAAAGHDVCVASGGMPVPQLDHTNVTFVQLPPLRSDGVNFTRLLDSDGHVATQSYLDERQTLLNDTLSQLRPDVLITELFPFGRRSLKHEFQGLLQQAKDLTTPLVLGSIRDILAPPSKPAKADFAVDMVTRFYDAVMVHSDANITPLSLSWPVGPELEPFLHYTGFVAPPKPQPHPNEAGKGEVIVSAGGGDVGTRLFEAAIPDFREMLNHAAISVSMCGYNTALDVLQTGVPAVFIPFDAGGEVEQSIRANALSKQSNISVLVDAKLAPETLLLQVQSGLKHPRNTGRSAGFDGAAHTVSIIENLLCERTKQ